MTTQSNKNGNKILQRSKMVLFGKQKCKLENRKRRNWFLQRLPCFSSWALLARAVVAPVLTFQWPELTFCWWAVWLATDANATGNLGCGPWGIWPFALSKIWPMTKKNFGPSSTHFGENAYENWTVGPKKFGLKAGSNLAIHQPTFFGNFGCGPQENLPDGPGKILTLLLSYHDCGNVCFPFPIWTVSSFFEG